LIKEGILPGFRDTRSREHGPNTQPSIVDADIHLVHYDHTIVG
jgi:hypothetical protein